LLTHLCNKGEFYLMTVGSNSSASQNMGLHLMAVRFLLLSEVCGIYYREPHPAAPHSPTPLRISY
jgi:hypothetical protein